MAVEQMKRYGIPASITLAQGLLESGAGTSMLAQKANNHFGIKIGGTWTGPYVTKDDDRQGERFRKYASVEESFEDHSRFLAERQRYASLFNLDPTDYRGWAYGLKEAGYATNPEYAKKLISLIDIYKLHEFDVQKGHRHGHSSHEQQSEQPRHQEQQPVVQQAVVPQPQQATPQGELRMGMCNGCRYVLARNGDTFASIAHETGVSVKKLIQYNEVDAAYQIRRGEPIYLDKKKTHVAENQRGQYHVLKAGQSIHTVSQLYGVRLERIYRANNLGPDYMPSVGDRLLLD